MKSHTAYLVFNTRQHREYINITAQVAAEVHKSGVACFPDGRQAQPGLGAVGPQAAASKSGKRGGAAQGPAPMKAQRRKRVVIKVMGE